MSEVLKPITSIIGGVGSVLGLGQQGSTTINSATPVNTDEAINQADEQLRKRQRKGVSANILTGAGGDTSGNSSGQKTLLGG